MQKGTCFFIIVCCLLLALSSCAVAPAKETENSSANVQVQATTQATEPAAEATNPQDAITTEKYTLFWEDGKSYMKRHSREGNDASDGNAMIIAYYPTFSSIREMRQKLIAGDLEEKEIAELMRNAPKGTDVTEICDINKLYEATYPEDISLEQITFFGGGYGFEFGIGYMMCTSEMDYLSAFDKDYNGKAYNVTILSVEKVADRNAEVTHYDNVGTKGSWVRYTNETDHGTQYIMEVYREDILDMIYIFGTSNGGYYYAKFFEIEERPSFEWLSSFGLREYVETEVS